MKNTIKTDPFTGLAFHAIEDNDGNLIASPAFNRPMMLRYSKERNSYEIPADYFDYIETMTVKEVMNALDISKARVSVMCSNGTLRSVKINGSIIIDKRSVDKLLDVTDGVDYDCGFDLE